MQKWAALRDSIFNEEKVEVLKINTDFELDQAYQEKELARQQATLAQNEQKQQLALTYTSSFIALLLLIIGAIIWNSRRIISKKNQDLDKKNRLIALQKADIRHRTKNVLERVVYVLQLVSREIDDEEQKYQLKRGENMIFALSNLEETLYEVEDEEQVPTLVFFRKLLQELTASHLLNFKLHIDINKSLTLPIDMIIPLALIMAEVITNAIKHAFKGISDPTIWVMLQLDEDVLQLTVRDNEVGFEGELIAKGFGQRLINRLADHLEGDIDYTTDNGTLFSLTLLLKTTETNQIYEVTAR